MKITGTDRLDFIMKNNAPILTVIDDNESFYGYCIDMEAIDAEILKERESGNNR